MSKENQIYEKFQAQIVAGVDSICIDVLEMLAAKDGGSTSEGVTEAIKNSIQGMPDIAIIGCAISAIIGVMEEDPDLNPKINEQLDKFATVYIQNARETIFNQLKEEGIL